MIAFTIAFTLICQTSEAQFQLILKGKPSPYDSGVVIELPHYRVIRYKLSTADTYITALKKQVDSLQAEVKIWDELNLKFQALDSAQELSRQRNEQSFKELNKSFDKLLSEATKPKKWYEKPIVWIGGGAIATWLLTR